MAPQRHLPRPQTAQILQSDMEADEAAGYDKSQRRWSAPTTAIAKYQECSHCGRADCREPGHLPMQGAARDA